jgi:hypothetical protein
MESVWWDGVRLHIVRDQTRYIYVCVCVYFLLPHVYMSSVKTRALTQLSDRKEPTRNGSATDVDVDLFVG